MKSIKWVLCFLLAIFILIPTDPARADGAPPPDITSLGGVGPFRYQSTEVQMEYERVEMELQEEPGDDPAHPINQISVNAWFIMNNTGSVDEKMQVIFPLDNINDCVDHADSPLSTPMLFSSSYSYQIIADSFNVSVDGVSESTTPVTTESPDTGKLPDSCTNEPMHWAGFDVLFPVNQNVLIRVNYMMKSSTTTTFHITTTF